MRKADKFDRQILNRLQKKANRTHQEIGDEIGLHGSVVGRRIKVLEEFRFILGYQAVISREKLELPQMVFVLLRLKVHEAGPFLVFRDDVLPVRFPNVVECFKLSGYWDLLLKVVCQDMKEYDDLVVALAGHKEYVDRIESHPVMWPVGDLNWKSPILPI